MFGNRSVSVQLVKTPKTGTDAAMVACNHPSTEEIIEIAQDQVMNIAKLAGFLYLGKKVIDTACDIAVLTAKSNLK